MPELPEVETTASILNKLIKGKVIISVWTDYNSAYYSNSENIKNPKYFNFFKKQVVGRKIIGVKRRAKNVLIDISGSKTILIHMKMTGHLLYGKYKILNKKWVPAVPNSPLSDPFNKYVHLVFVLNNGKQVVLSDARKFATVHLISDKEALRARFSKTGIGPLEKGFSWQIMKKLLLARPNLKIKTALLDQNLIAGIGNIYSDEILWQAKMHPERLVRNINEAEWRKVFQSTIKLLAEGIKFGGDSMSDYRNPYGLPGEFQNHHKVYRRKNEKCFRKNCGGQIVRKIVGQRSAHFCAKCQGLSPIKPPIQHNSRSDRNI